MTSVSAIATDPAIRASQACQGSTLVPVYDVDRRLVPQDVARAMLEAFTPLVRQAQDLHQEDGGNVGLLLKANPYHLFQGCWDVGIAAAAVAEAHQALVVAMEQGVPVHADFAATSARIADALQHALDHAMVIENAAAWVRNLLRHAGLVAADVWPALRAPAAEADPVLEAVEDLIAAGEVIPEADVEDAAQLRQAMADVARGAAQPKLLHDVLRHAMAAPRARLSERAVVQAMEALERAGAEPDDRAAPAP